MPIDAAIATDAAAVENASPVIVAPLIALGSALGVFLIVVLAIVLDSECRKRRNRAKCKSNITSHVATEKPEIINWRDIEVGAPIRTPTTPNNFHEDNILEEDEEDMVEAEPLDFEPAYSTGHGDVGDDDNANKQRPLSEILIDRLDVKEEDEVHAYESPLDYGYEGGDDSESTRPNE